MFCLCVTLSSIFNTVHTVDKPRGHCLLFGQCEGKKIGNNKIRNTSNTNIHWWQKKYITLLCSSYRHLNWECLNENTATFLIAILHWLLYFNSVILLSVAFFFTLFNVLSVFTLNPCRSFHVYLFSLWLVLYTFINRGRSKLVLQTVFSTKMQHQDPTGKNIKTHNDAANMQKSHIIII